MSIHCEEYNGVCVMSVNGDFAADDAAHARKHAEGLIDHRQLVDFVIDLEHAPFVDSQGLEAMLWIKRKCEDLFGQIKLAGAGEGVRKILEMTRLSHRFECAADVPTALKTMR
jgi:anti-sigma B factor antagonist